MKVKPLPPLTDSYVMKTIHDIADNLNKPNQNLSHNLNKPSDHLILPWPDKLLSPNKRIHWAKRAKASKTARQIGFSLARLAGWNKDYFLKMNCYGRPDNHSINYLTKRYDLMLDFYPPNKRRRDDDNLIAAFKPYRDGIASALNIDDFRFRTVALVHEEVIKKGQVTVRLR